MTMIKVNKFKTRHNDLIKYKVKFKIRNTAKYDKSKIRIIIKTQHNLINTKQK